MKRLQKVLTWMLVLLGIGLPMLILTLLLGDASANPIPVPRSPTIVVPEKMYVEMVGIGDARGVSWCWIEEGRPIWELLSPEVPSPVIEDQQVMVYPESKFETGECWDGTVFLLPRDVVAQMAAGEGRYVHAKARDRAEIQRFVGRLNELVLK